MSSLTLYGQAAAQFEAASIRPSGPDQVAGPSGWVLFAKVLSRVLGIPVVDRTGLTGPFNFDLVWNPDSPLTTEFGTGAASDANNELFRAIRERLGLTLRSRRMAVEILVVDHAEKPQS